MAYVDNSETIAELNLAVRGNSSTNRVPTQLSNVIQPTIEINPLIVIENNYSKTGATTATGTLTILTTSPDKDTYITNIQVGLAKDVACDIATGSMNLTGTKDGGSIVLARIPLITLTAQNNNHSVTFAKPIKLDRSTTITLGGTYAAGVCVRTACINGFEIDKV